MDCPSLAHSHHHVFSRQEVDADGPGTRRVVLEIRLHRCCQWRELRKVCGHGGDPGVVEGRGCSRRRCRVRGGSATRGPKSCLEARSRVAYSTATQVLLCPARDPGV